jgi:hypothetical protein
MKLTQIKYLVALVLLVAIMIWFVQAMFILAIQTTDRFIKPIETKGDIQ